MGILFHNRSKDWFAKNVRVRSFVNISDIQNKWIMEGVKCVVNVSSDYDEAVCTQLCQMGVAYFWFPMSEQNEDMGIHSIYGALKVLQLYIDRKDAVIIHCFGGNNRSKVVYEALYYLNFGSWPNNSSDCKTRTNCKEGHLPSEQHFINLLQHIKDGKSLDDCLRQLS